MHRVVYLLTSEMLSRFAVNSALAEIQKLKEVKDMLGKVENMINSFRGGKQSRLFLYD